jgi:hypothetical protein
LGCTKEVQFNPNYDVFGFKNGAEWKATSISYYESVDTISLQADTYNQFGEWRENLYIVNIPIRTGKYTICKSWLLDTNATAGKYHTLIADGDVLEGIFDVYEGNDNFIEIQEVDKKRNFVKGRFQVTFIQDTISNPYKPDLPDTIRFINCVFTTCYKK